MKKKAHKEKVRESSHTKYAKTWCSHWLPLLLWMSRPIFIYYNYYHQHCCHGRVEHTSGADACWILTVFILSISVARSISDIFSSACFLILADIASSRRFCSCQLIDISLVLILSLLFLLLFYFYPDSDCCNAKILLKMIQDWVSQLKLLISFCLRARSAISSYVVRH